VIDGQVAGRMGIALVAGAPVPVLATPGAEHAGAEALPLPGAVQGVVAATVRLARMLGAATAGSARSDTADGAELHGPARSGADTVVPLLTLVTLDCTPWDIAMSVSEECCAVYSSAVLRLRAEPRASDGAPKVLYCGRAAGGRQRGA
jgi:hypothetical protein